MNKTMKEILNAFYSLSSEDKKKVIQAMDDIGINAIDVNKLTIEDLTKPHT